MHVKAQKIYSRQWILRIKNYDTLNKSTKLPLKFKGKNYSYSYHKRGLLACSPQVREENSLWGWRNEMTQGCQAKICYVPWQRLHIQIYVKVCDRFLESTKILHPI